MCESDRSRHQINPRRFFLSFVRCVVLIHLQLIHHSLLLLPGDDDAAAGPPRIILLHPCSLLPRVCCFAFRLNDRGRANDSPKEGTKSNGRFKNSCQFISHFRSRRRHRRQLSPAPRTRRNPNERGCSL